MNITFFSAKQAVLGAVLLAAFGVVGMANAAVTITEPTTTINGDPASATVLPEAEVTIVINASKTGGQCENNWNYTKVTVTGPEGYLAEYVSAPFWGDDGKPEGGGKTSDSVTFDAPVGVGVYGVLIEVVGGGEIYGTNPVVNCNDSVFGIPAWPITANRTLNVEIPPSIEMLSISPLDGVRYVGDTNPVTYVAKVKVSGSPVSGNLQCVIFDLFRGDGWQEVDVTGQGYNVPGTYDILLPSPDYDVSALAVGQYDVLAIASEQTCDDFTDDDFTTATYRGGEDDQYYAGTVLNIVDYFTIDGYKFNDLDGDGVWDKEAGELGLEGWTISATDGKTSTTTTTGKDGYYSFEVWDGVWTVTEVQQDGWSQTAPKGLSCEFTTGREEGSGENGRQTEDFRCDFGNKENKDEQEEEPRRSSSTGTRVGDRDRSSRDSSDSSDTTETLKTPVGQVLGESTSVVPVGAPNTGAGGTAPLSVQLPALTAILSTRSFRKVS